MKNKKDNIFGSLVYSVFLPFYTILTAITITIGISCKIIKENMLYEIVRGWAKFNLKMLQLLTGLKVEYENVPKNMSGQIIASEHQSTLEILALIAIVPRPVFVLKKSLMKLPFFGYCLRKLGMIPVDRKNRNVRL